MDEIDEIFRQFATYFTGDGEEAEPICFPDQLRREALDLSLASLKVVDDYLTYLHLHKDELSDDAWGRTVLYGGAYLGEVIRYETANRYRWSDYNEYMPAHPELQERIPERLTQTCAFLVNDEVDAMTMPLNKIARYIEEGEEHNTQFYARCEIDHQDEGS